jgi:hypothetical protein
MQRIVRIARREMLKKRRIRYWFEETKEKNSRNLPAKRYTISLELSLESP